MSSRRYCLESTSKFSCQEVNTNAKIGIIDVLILELNLLYLAISQAAQALVVRSYYFFFLSLCERSVT